MTVLRPQTFVLSAGSPAALVWSAADFQRNFDNAVIQQRVSLAVQITHNLQQALYATLSYTTLDTTVTIAERKAFAGISQASTDITASVYITPRSVPALANLPKNITSIRLTLQSVGSGTVTAQIELLPTEGSGSGAQSQFIGQDSRTEQDYAIERYTNNGIITDTDTILNNVAGTQIRFDYVSVFIPRTPLMQGGISFEIQTNATGVFVTTFLLESDPWVPVQYQGKPFGDTIIQPPESFIVTMINNMGYAIVFPIATYNVIVHRLNR